MNRAVAMLLGMQIKHFIHSDNRPTAMELDTGLHAVLEDFSAARMSVEDEGAERITWIVSANAAQVWAALGKFDTARDIIGEMELTNDPPELAHETTELKRRVGAAAQSATRLSLEAIHIAI